MMAQTLSRALAASLLLGLAVLCSAAPTAPDKKDAPIPFPCFTQAWDGHFEVVSARHDKNAGLLIWTLKAKKDTRVGTYVAFLGDGDNVELGTFQVKITPARAEVKSGNQLQAIVSVRSITVSEVSQLTIRERR
jgi:hypothetical protein